MAITSWTNMILPRLAGANKTLVEEEIKRTIDNFCRDSTAWRRMIYGLHVDAGDREVEIVVDDGSEAEVVQILRVYYDQQQLTPYSHTPWEVTTNRPTGWTAKSSDPSIIVLSTIPTQTLTDALDAWVALRPIDPVTNATPLIDDLFWETIFDGTLGRMYNQEDKPYGDTAKATYHLARYRNGIRKARDMGGRGFTGNAQNWVFPKFGR